MTDPKMPYDVAKAVRAARQKMLEKLQLGVAHARSHSGQFGNTGKSLAPDMTRADDVDTSIGKSPTPDTGKTAAPVAATGVGRLDQLLRESGDPGNASDPKPWKKPWDV